jgi:hypothetical protein
MSNLTDLAVAAHGGWERWQQLDQLRAHINVGGAMWQVKGWPDVYADIHCSVATKRQHAEFTPFLKAGQHGVYEPYQTAIVSDGGAILEKRDAPRASFEGHTLPTPWDAQQLIYFTGYAMWTYLTTPFLFKMPGFKTEEIEPWNENGEIWRRLKVAFPASFHSHSTEQTFYFDSDGLLRRHDYSVEIMGGTASANCASGHKTIGGLIFPTKRRVYAIGPDNRPVLDRVAVAIDFLSIEAT